MPWTMTRVPLWRRIAISRAAPSSGQLHDLLGGLPAAGGGRDTVLLEDGAALLLVCSREPDDQRKTHAPAGAGLDQPPSHLVPACDPAEDVHQDAAHFGIHQDHGERVLDHLRLRAST